jgi:hypothetical protein
MGELDQAGVDCIVAALAVASCNVQVIDLQTDTPPCEVDADMIETLFSTVNEVTVCGELLHCPGSYN